MHHDLKDAIVTGLEEVSSFKNKVLQSIILQVNANICYEKVGGM